MILLNIVNLHVNMYSSPSPIYRIASPVCPNSGYLLEELPPLRMRVCRLDFDGIQERGYSDTVLDAHNKLIRAGYLRQVSV